MREWPAGTEQQLVSVSERQEGGGEEERSHPHADNGTRGTVFVYNRGALENIPESCSQ